MDLRSDLNKMQDVQLKTDDEGWTECEMLKTEDTYDPSTAHSLRWMITASCRGCDGILRRSHPKAQPSERFRSIWVRPDWHISLGVRHNRSFKYALGPSFWTARHGGSATWPERGSFLLRANGKHPQQGRIRRSYTGHNCAGHNHTVHVTATWTVAICTITIQALLYRP